MNVKDIAKKYCEFVRHYESYCEQENAKYPPTPTEEFTKNMNKDEKNIFLELQNFFTKEYAPWVLIPRENFLEEVIKVFTNEPDKIYHYAQMTNSIIDSFSFTAYDELEKYYQDNGIERKGEEIFEDLEKFHSKEDLNKDIFSEDTINLFDLYKEAEQLQKDITDYVKSIEHEKELEEEIEK